MIAKYPSSEIKIIHQNAEQLLIKESTTTYNLAAEEDNRFINLWFKYFSFMTIIGATAPCFIQRTDVHDCMGLPSGRLLVSRGLNSAHLSALQAPTFEAA